MSKCDGLVIIVVVIAENVAIKDNSSGAENDPAIATA